MDTSRNGALSTSDYHTDCRIFKIYILFLIKAQSLSSSSWMTLLKSLFNLEAAPLQTRYKRRRWRDDQTVETALGGHHSFRLPHIVFWENVILFRDLILLGARVSRNILFPEGKMFLSFLVCPGVLPTALEKLEGHDCWCFHKKKPVCFNWMWDESAQRRGTN